MPVNCQVITFQKGTGANGSTQDVGLNFTPTAILLFSSNSTTTTLANEYSQTIGFSDGTNHAAIAIHSDDGSAAADTGRIHSNADVYIKLSQTVPTTTVLARGSVVFQTNNLRFTWTVNDAVANRITVVAFGGNDITAAKVNTVDINETVDGATEDYTGLGFTPSEGHSIIFFIGINHTANSSTTPTTTAIANFGCTCSTLSTNQWTISNCAENNSDPSDTFSVPYGNSCYSSLDTAGALDHLGNVSAFIVDGFRITWANAPSSTTVKFSYLAINGGEWDTDTLVAPTTPTNDVDETVGVNAMPIKGLMLISTGGGSGTIAAPAVYSIGATDGTTHSVHASIDEDAQLTIDGYRIHETTSLWYMMTTDGALTDRATFDSFSTNNFRLDYPTKTAAIQAIGYMVVADQTAAAVEEISYQSYGNIHQKFDSNKNAIFG